MSASRRLRFTIGQPFLRYMGWFWLVVGTGAVLSSSGTDRILWAVGSLPLALGLLLATRPTRVTLDAEAGTVRVVRPTFPTGSRIETRALRDIVALEVEPGTVTYRARFSRQHTEAAGRLMWRMKDGSLAELWPMDSRDHRDGRGIAERVNAFLRQTEAI